MIIGLLLLFGIWGQKVREEEKRRVIRQDRTDREEHCHCDLPKSCEPDSNDRPFMNSRLSLTLFRSWAGFSNLFSSCLIITSLSFFLISVSNSRSLRLLLANDRSGLKSSCAHSLPAGCWPIGQQVKRERFGPLLSPLMSGVFVEHR